MAKRQHFDGALTATDVASVLNFLGLHMPVRDAIHTQDQVDSIECGRAIILGWCKHALLRDQGRYRLIGSEEVMNVLAFLNSQQYLEGTRYETEEMEHAQSLILGWCEYAIRAEIISPEMQDAVDVITCAKEVSHG